MAVTQSEQPLQNGDQAESDKAQFLAALQSSLEIFVNRMRSNSQRGRPIANDSSVQSLFTVISNMHPQLLKYQQEMEDNRGRHFVIFSYRFMFLSEIVEDQQLVSHEKNDPKG